MQVFLTGTRFRNTFATRNGSLRFGRQNAAGPDAPKARGRALPYPESIRCRCGVRKPNPTPVSSRISRALFCTGRSRRSTGPISRCERQERYRLSEAATRKVRNPSRTGRPKMPDITVLPTFWETYWAWILYVVLFVLSTATIVYIILYIYRLRHQINIEQQLANIKLRFFTDISHELRTLLTLIASPVSEKEKL